jgi:hypothetical protein
MDKPANSCSYFRAAGRSKIASCCNACVKCQRRLTSKRAWFRTAAPAGAIGARCCEVALTTFTALAPRARQLADWSPTGEAQLSLDVGDIVRVVHPVPPESPWWWVELVARHGRDPTGPADAGYGGRSGRGSPAPDCDTGCGGSAGGGGCGSGSGSSGSDGSDGGGGGGDGRDDGSGGGVYGGLRGYVPSSYLRPVDSKSETLTHAERWQNDEYYGSYGFVKVCVCACVCV